jgi:hypothetical protein
MNLNCLVCKRLFGEWDTVICDSCTRPTHRETCGKYELVVRDGEQIAYFFCTPCLDEFPVLDLNDDEWEAQ